MPGERLQEVLLVSVDDAAAPRSDGQDEGPLGQVGLASELIQAPLRILDVACADMRLDQIRQHWPRRHRVCSDAFASQALRALECVDCFLRSTQAQLEQADCRPEGSLGGFDQVRSFCRMLSTFLLATHHRFGPREPVEGVGQLAFLAEGADEVDRLLCREQPGSQSPCSELGEDLHAQRNREHAERAGLPCPLDCPLRRFASTLVLAR